MKKRFEGKIISLKMANTVVVEVERQVVHPLYKKLLKRSSKFKADSEGLTLNLGNKVIIEETKPISKDKNFKVLEVIK